MTALPTLPFPEPSRSRIFVAELYTKPEPGYWADRFVLRLYFPPGLGGMASGLKFDLLDYWLWDVTGTAYSSGEKSLLLIETCF